MSTGRLRVRWLLLLPMLTLVAMQVFVNVRRGCSECRRVDALLRLAGAISPMPLAKMIEDVVREVAPGRTVHLNKPYRDDAIMVYLVDSDKLAARDAGVRIAGHRLSEILRNNFVSISPNVILIDDTFLAMLVSDAFNDAVGYAQAMPDLGSIPADEPSQAAWIRRAEHRQEMFSTAFVYQQYTNLESLSTPEDRAEWRHIGGDFMEGLRVADKIVRESKRPELPAPARSRKT